ncbi:MAG: hypothetical protein KAI91_01385 [Candidatus Omnitrophica bacterium]|nr:hypothetical protein [Candidatus Omnitrophota bacterium]
MVKLKSIFIGFIACLGLIVSFQNTQVEVIRFLFWEASISSIILFPLLISVGFVMGFILAKSRRKNR